jgi:hypothetical protein
VTSLKKDEVKIKAVGLLSEKERIRHLKKHIEMERLFGSDFLPVSKRVERDANPAERTA